MSNKNIYTNSIFVGILFVVGIFSYQYFHTVQVKYLSITNFKACVDAGFTVVPSYPEKCVMPGKFFSNPLQKAAASTQGTQNATTSEEYKEIQYLFDGQLVKLKDGVGTVSGSANNKQSSSTLRVIGKPFFHDTNDDGKLDTIFLLDLSSTGTNAYSQYLSVALQLNNRYAGTNALFVDNGIITVSFGYKNGMILINYTTVSSSTRNIEKHFMVTNGILEEINHK